MDLLVILLLLMEGTSLAVTQNVMCPEDIAVTAQPGETYVNVQWSEPVVLIPLFLTYKSHCPGQFPFGTTTVTYEYATFNGIMRVNESCSFNVMVTAADMTPPLVRDCPSSPIRTNFEVGTDNVLVTWTEPSATDDSGQVELVDSTARSGKVFYLGGKRRFPITYTFQDQTGNKAFCYFEILFVAVDTTAPIIQDCPDPLVQDVPVGVMGTVVSLRFPSVHDESGQFTWTVDPVVADNFFLLGTHQISYNFTDASGNFAECVTSVQVVSRDITPPEIVDCPSSSIIGVQPGVNNVHVDWSQPEAEDNSGTVLLDSQSHQPGIYSVNTTLQVSYVYRDLAYNQATCQFMIRVVEDGESPTIFGCSTKGIQRFIQADQNEIEVFWGEPFSLDETHTEIVHQSHYPGYEFIVGNTVVAYTFEDSAGNSASCIFNVSVEIIEDDPAENDTNIIVLVIIICLLVLVVTLVLVIGVTICWFQNAKESTRSSSFPPAPPYAADNEGFYEGLGEQKEQEPSNSVVQSPTTNADYIEMEAAEKIDSYLKP